LENLNYTFKEIIVRELRKYLALNEILSLETCRIYPNQQLRGSI
jgi:hypothetical protein